MLSVGVHGYGSSNHILHLSIGASSRCPGHKTVPILIAMLVMIVWLLSHHFATNEWSRAPPSYSDNFGRSQVRVSSRMYMGQSRI